MKNKNRNQKEQEIQELIMDHITEGVIAIFTEFNAKG